MRLWFRQYHLFIKNKNRWIVLLLDSFFIPLSADAQEPYMEESFAVDNNVNVEVQTSRGSIEVKGSKRNNVHVEMFVKQRGKEIDAKKVDLDDWDIIIEKKGNTVYATAKKRKKLVGVEIISAFRLLCIPQSTQKRMLKLREGVLRLNT